MKTYGLRDRDWNGGLNRNCDRERHRDRDRVRDRDRNKNVTSQKNDHHQIEKSRDREVIDIVTKIDIATETEARYL